MMKPKFTTYFPDAAVREGADELALRAAEGVLRSFMDTTNVGDKRWEPALADGDWHAICLAIYKGVEGAEWETIYCKYVELSTLVHDRSERQESRFL